MGLIGGQDENIPCGKLCRNVLQVVGDPAADDVVNLKIVVAVQVQRLFWRANACDMKIVCSVAVIRQHKFFDIHKDHPPKNIPRNWIKCNIFRTKCIECASVFSYNKFV